LSSHHLHFLNTNTFRPQPSNPPQYNRQRSSRPSSEYLEPSRNDFGLFHEWTKPKAKEDSKEEAQVQRTSQKTSQKEPEMPFRLIDLSAEPRNMVYGYALRALKLQMNKKKSLWDEYRSPPSSSAELVCPVGANVDLLRSCKQVYAETKALLFELKTFRLTVHSIPDIHDAIAQ
jgi:hypothetical protein